MIKDISEQEENDMDAIIQDMMSYFCDELCRHPRYALDQEELDQSCAECRMREFRQRILDEYNELNDFEKTSCAALMKKYNKVVLCDECKYHTVEVSTGIHWCRLGDGLKGELKPGDGCGRGKRRE